MEVPPRGFTNKILLTDWEESHVSDAKVPKFRLEARSARSHSFMCFSRVSGFLGRNKSSWTRPYHESTLRVSRVLQGHNLLYRQKLTMWFINRILRRIVCFRPQNTTNFGSLAISIAFSCVSGFLIGIKIHKYIYICFWRKSAKISARSLCSLTTINGFFSSFWKVSGRYKSSWTRDHKILTSVTNIRTHCTDRGVDPGGGAVAPPIKILGGGKHIVLPPPPPIILPTEKIHNI